MNDVMEALLADRAQRIKTLAEAMYQARKYGPDDGFPTYEDEALAVTEWVECMERDADGEAVALKQAKRWGKAL